MVDNAPDLIVYFLHFYMRDSDFKSRSWLSDALVAEPLACRASHL